MKKSAIVDTNIFLQWDVQTVDWCKELGAKEVDIIVCRPVLRELDKWKNSGDKRLSERARRNIALIESIKPLRENVNIVALVKEPKIDWEKEELDPNIEDDRIIATMLERGNVDDVLITDDAAPRITARSKNFDVQALNAPRLPETKSELEKQLEKANREILDLKNNSPQLSLRLDARAENGKLVKFKLKRHVPLSEREIKTLVTAREKLLLFKAQESKSTLASAILDIEGFKKDIKNYLIEYEEFLREKDKVDAEMSLILSFDFVLEAGGKVPALDIRCIIQFPRELKVLREDDLPEKPKEPQQPIPMPIGILGLMRATGQLSSFNDSLYSSVLPPLSNGERQTSLLLEKNEAKIWVKSLQHGFELRPDTLYVKLSSFDEARSFQICYSIHASNLREAVLDSIPIVLEK